ncbi:OmpP1/FadL family transporter [Ferrimonas marina]|uniref:Long-chain fatty acid transport protein n=1 Tax=Ferrimonas marina TaxID=299255 RepID=A0A1M5YAE1_9GAMM|nr:porin [Ferrimonas marina]SHI09015.1 long-chain fatty acid transport protein [Ferrimonas marina]
MKAMNKTLIATAIAMTSAPTLAAGFGLNSQSATGIGRAMAGDAVIADNASVLARNPAAMALFDERAFSGGVAYVDTQVDVMDVNYMGGMVDLGSIDDAADSKLVPNIFYIQPLSDKVAIGFGAFSNFGTGTDTGSLVNRMPTDENGIPQGPIDLIGNTEVTTINLNASVSYRVNDQLSLGAGLDIIQGQGKLTRAMDVISADADGWAFGGILGATYEFNENHRLGLSYRFSPDATVSGDIGASLVANLPTGNPLLPEFAAAITADFDELEVPLPDIFQIAGFHQLTNKFALHYTAQWTQWSVFEEITATNGVGTAQCVDNAVVCGIVGGQVPGGFPIDVDLGDIALKEYQWQDSWFLSVGGTYTLNDKWTLRAGYAYDQGVVGDIESLSIPDSDRQWFTAGVGYNLSAKSTIDLGIAYIAGEEVNLVEDSALAGPVNATTESGATYYSIQYSVRF